MSVPLRTLATLLAAAAFLPAPALRAQTGAVSEAGVAPGADKERELPKPEIEKRQAALKTDKRFDAYQQAVGGNADELKKRIDECKTEACFDYVGRMFDTRKQMDFRKFEPSAPAAAGATDASRDSFYRDGAGKMGRAPESAPKGLETSAQALKSGGFEAAPGDKPSPASISKRTLQGSQPVAEFKKRPDGTALGQPLSDASSLAGTQRAPDIPPGSVDGKGPGAQASPKAPEKKSWFGKLKDTFTDPVKRYEAGMKVLRPLDAVTPDQTLPGQALNRGRLELLKPAINDLSEKAKLGDADAQKKLNEIYAKDIKRDDWQPIGDQIKAKAIALDIGKDSAIREARNNWAQLGGTQREAALQKAADYAAAKYGLPAKNLEFKDIPCRPDGCVLGYFNPDDGRIVINKNNIGDFERVTDTVVHETTHRYQKQITDGPPPPAGFSLGANARDQYVLLKANEGYYIRYDEALANHSYENYRNQPLERGARQAGGDAVGGAAFIFNALNTVDAVRNAAGSFVQGLTQGQ